MIRKEKYNYSFVYVIHIDTIRLMHIFAYRYSKQKTSYWRTVPDYFGLVSQ